MKLQHLAIIFILIIVPISIVMSAYINNQIDAIKLQTEYDTSLISASYDAVMAFQINTTNNKYSSISDSKIRDIEASINTFYNSLNTSMREYALSTQDLEAYVPAMLFTLYDGYYIYTSYNNVYSTTDDGKVSINIDGNNYQTGLKPYVYYSAKYLLPITGNQNNIIIVNYTLDNAITVYGDFGDGYETRSGYLINPNLVNNVNESTHTLLYGETGSQVEIGPEELWEHLITIEDETSGSTLEGDYPYIFYENDKIYQDRNQSTGQLLYNEDGTPRIFWYNNYMKTYVNDPEIREYARQCGMRSYSAFEYYSEAKVFSNWVIEHLGSIEQSDTIKFENGMETIGNSQDYLSNNTGTEKIFLTSGNNDPMLSSSTFNNHRLAIIRKSIETNLNTVISNYSSNTLYDYAMPIITDDDWYRILNNVSLVTFMQGMSTGYSQYNNYAVITNNVNKEVVKAENIYIVAKENGTTNREYHQPGCEELIQGVSSGRLTIIGAYSTASFQRQTVKITEESEEYFYMQAWGGDVLTGCYNCIVNATGDYDINDIIDGTIEHYADNSNILYNANDLAEIREAYLTALARERNDLYKSSFDT